MNEMLTVVAGRPSVSVGDQGIVWSPISSPVRLTFLGTSKEAVAEALVKAFGPFPIRLKGGEQLFILRGLAAGAGQGSPPYDELLRALTQFGQLELTET